MEYLIILSTVGFNMIISLALTGIISSGSDYRNYIVSDDLMIFLLVHVVISAIVLIIMIKKSYISIDISKFTDSKNIMNKLTKTSEKFNIFRIDDSGNVYERHTPMKSVEDLPTKIEHIDGFSKNIKEVDDNFIQSEIRRLNDVIKNNSLDFCKDHGEYISKYPSSLCKEFANYGKHQINAIPTILKGVKIVDANIEYVMSRVKIYTKCAIQTEIIRTSDFSIISEFVKTHNVFGFSMFDCSFEKSNRMMFEINYTEDSEVNCVYDFYGDTLVSPIKSISVHTINVLREILDIGCIIKARFNHCYKYRYYEEGYTRNMEDVKYIVYHYVNDNKLGLYDQCKILDELNYLIIHPHNERRWHEELYPTL